MLRAVLRSSSVAADGKETPLVLCGGLLLQKSPLNYLLEVRIANEVPALAIVRDAKLPHFGALSEARALLEDDRSR